MDRSSLGEVLRERIGETVSKAAIGDSRFVELMEHLALEPWEETASIFYTPAEVSIGPFLRAWWFLHDEQPVPEDELAALREMTHEDVWNLGVHPQSLDSYSEALGRFWGWSDLSRLYP